jgi:hypothetical protein
MPNNFTTKSWLFPPKTREVQFDEKWSYVYKKQANCDPDDPADDHRGDCRDRVAIDPESRLVLAVVPGPRDVEAVEELVGETKRRTGDRILDLATGDEYPAYKTALLNAYGEELTTTATGRRSRRMVPDRMPPAGMNCATVEKRRSKGRVVEIVMRVVFGTMAGVEAALARSTASRRINTSFVERQNATDRHRNARKVRKTYTFSKDWSAHEAMTYFTI